MTPTRNLPSPPAPGQVAFLARRGPLGATYEPVEVIKVNRRTAAVRDALGEVTNVRLEDLAPRTVAGLPAAPASRAEALVAAYRRATEEVVRAREEVQAASERRRALILELSGLWSVSDMSRRLGISRGRISQILKGGGE